jgi:hypothetical protein
MNSERLDGLSRVEVIVDADLMLKCDKFKDERGVGGPGFASMSPAMRRRREVRKVVGFMRRGLRGDRGGK